MVPLALKVSLVIVLTLSVTIASSTNPFLFINKGATLGWLDHVQRTLESLLRRYLLIITIVAEIAMLHFYRFKFGMLLHIADKNLWLEIVFLDGLYPINDFHFETQHLQFSQIRNIIVALDVTML